MTTHRAHSYVFYYYNSSRVVDCKGNTIYYEVQTPIGFCCQGGHEDEYVWENLPVPLDVDDILDEQQKAIVRAYGISNCYWDDSNTGKIIVLVPVELDIDKKGYIINTKMI